MMFTFLNRIINKIKLIIIVLIVLTIGGCQNSRDKILDEIILGIKKSQVLEEDTVNILNIMDDYGKLAFKYDVMTDSCNEVCHFTEKIIMMPDDSISKEVTDFVFQKHPNTFFIKNGQENYPAIFITGFVEDENNEVACYFSVINKKNKTSEGGLFYTKKGKVQYRRFWQKEAL